MPLGKLFLFIAIGLITSSCFVKRNRIFLEAVKAGDDELVVSLLDQGANVNARDYQYGADLDLRIDTQITALMLAAFSGHKEIVETLLEYGADPNRKSDGESTALILAASEGHYETVKALLDHGARVDDQDSTGRTALMYAAGVCHSDYNEGQTETVQVLLEYGADVNLKDTEGQTALMHAEANGHQEITQLLRSKE